MPFTIGGEWIPNSSQSKTKSPIKILKEKRRLTYVTIILHLPQTLPQLKDLCSTLKQRLGCGGSVKDDRIELQGDQIEAVKAYLKEHGYN